MMSRTGPGSITHFSAKHLLNSLLVLSTLLLFHPGLCGPTPDLSPQATRVHLHIHAMSNHNASDYPASVQWQFAQAANLPGDDFIWWTEHSEILKMSSPLVMSFGGWENHVDEKRLFLPKEGRKGAEGKSLRVWEYTASENTTLNLREGILDINIGAHSSEGGGSFHMVPRSLRGRVHTIVFACPVNFGGGIELNFNNLVIPEDSYLAVNCTLSYHWDSGPHAPVVRFLVSGESADKAVYVPDRGDGWSVEAIVPYTAGVSSLFLDVGNAAELLPDGTDNTLAAFEISAFNGSERNMNLSLESVVIQPGEWSSTDIVNFNRSLLEKYAKQYSVGQHSGVEFRFLPLSFHMTSYLPDVIPSEWYSQQISKDRREWVEEVHEKHGLVSLCHVLGCTPFNPENEEIVKTRETHFKDLLQADAYGADLLEVGYRERGYGRLEDYLLLWDGLTASGVYLRGIGVTDSHGGIWPESDHSWATWVYNGQTADSILVNLKKGRCYLGDFNRWDGQLDLRIGRWGMGDVVAELPDWPSLVVSLEPEEPNLYTSITMIPLNQKLESLADLKYEKNNWEVIPNRPQKLWIPGPCAIRASVWRIEEDGSRLIVALTNPVLFTGTNPKK